jgi:hypothetical protein
MFTIADFIIFVMVGVIVGGLYGATGYLILTPSKNDPHPGRRTTVLGAIGGGSLFALAALLLENATAGLLFAALLLLIGLIWRPRI